MSYVKWVDKTGSVHEGNLLREVNNFMIIDCELCKFKHVTPMPTFDELSDVYSHEYYAKEKPFYIERYLEDRDWWKSVYTERFEFLEKYIPVSSRSILDVGSGPGLFLDAARERGWKTLGVEPSNEASAFSRNTLNLDVRSIFLNNETKDALGLFSAINLGEVLEHLPEPREMLQIVKSMLNIGGVLTIIVPNDFNPIQNILSEKLGVKPWWVAPPHHLNYFDVSSLTNLVGSIGFDVLHTETTFPIDIFLLMGLNYIGDDVVGRQAHLYRKNLEINLSRSGEYNFKQLLYKEFSKLGLGREIVLYAQKNKDN